MDGHELAVSERAAAAIQSVSDTGEVKAVGDKAAAIRLYAQKQGWSQEQKVRIAQIEVRAGVRLGELPRETEKQAGARGIGKRGSVGKPHLSRLSEFGITKKQSHISQLAAEVPTVERERYLAGDFGEGVPKLSDSARLAIPSLRAGTC